MYNFEKCEIDVKRRNSKGMVTLNYHIKKGKKQYYQVYFSKTIIDKCGYKVGDRVDFLFDKGNGVFAVQKNNVGVFTFRKSVNALVISSVNLAAYLKINSGGCIEFEPEYIEDDNGETMLVLKPVRGEDNV